MATTTSTQQDMRALAARLRADLGVRGPRTVITGGALAALGRLANYRDMGWPDAAIQAVHGIVYGLQTGRVSGRVRDAVLDLSAWRLCQLVAECAAECTVQGQVPSWLIRRYGK